MKILFFSSDNNPFSGAFRAELNLIDDLKKKGHQVTLVLPYHNKNGLEMVKSKGIDYKHILSFPWVCSTHKTIFSGISHGATMPFNAIASQRIKSLIKKNNFDLAVVNTLWNGVGGKAAIQLGIPTIWHLREILETGQNRRFYNREKSFSIIGKSSKCISVSNSVKNYYEANLPTGIIQNIYDGVDENIFINNSKQLFNTDTAHILMLGTVNEPKGQHLGLKALNELSHLNFDVKIVGKCSPQYKAKLLSLIPNIYDRVEFVSATNEPQKYYEWADIFLMNSIGEAFGLVTAEAMMGGVVTIASKCDGSLEIIGNDSNGYFYEPSNWQDLKEKINYVILHKDEAKQKALCGQKRALEYFSKNKNSSLIEQVYLQNKKV